MSHITRRSALITASALPLAARAAWSAAPKNIVLIGATAQSAPEVIKQALEQGRKVTALARRPDDVTGKGHANLTIIKGDVRDQASIESALTGKEVVISLIGPRVDPRVEVEFMDLYTVGTANIAAAMKKKGNKKLLVTSSVGAEHVVTEKPKSTDLRDMWLWNARKLYADMAAMEKMMPGLGLQYIILRPGFMIDRPQANNLKIAVDDKSPKGAGPIITFADFAAFILAQVDSDQYNSKAVSLFSDEQSEWGKNLDFNALLKKREATGPMENVPVESAAKTAPAASPK
ncbi:MAG: NAD(P)H-binding protein [Rhodospirillaceae bacterium]|nr:NAD(P)H-binding protein [Rhodospirillaceae bacterium]